MRISTKTSYGLDALFDLAFHCTGRAAQAREIAERQEIPLRYLEQILQDLRRAGVVEAKRGPRGGYALCRAPETVRLLDVVVALEGPFDPLGTAEELEAKRGRSVPGARVPTLVWRELGARFEAVCAGVTLKDLVDRAVALGLARAEPPSQMYFL